MHSTWSWDWLSSSQSVRDGERPVIAERLRRTALVHDATRQHADAAAPDCCEVTPPPRAVAPLPSSTPPARDHTLRGTNRIGHEVWLRPGSIGPRPVPSRNTPSNGLGNLPVTKPE